MTTPILIHGGRVIDPASGFDAVADVLLAGGAVAAVAAPGEAAAPRDATRLDADGCIVAPGLIDLHVHFREPGPSHEETIRTGSAAAVAGGFTTVCCMPNTTPPLDSAAQIGFVAERAEAAAGARVFAVGCATRDRAGAAVADLAAMTRAGAVAFSDDGDCVASPEVMTEVLRASRAVDRTFMQHCQDPAMTRGAAMNAGAIADRLGVVGWPVEAEESIIARDIELNRAIGARYHVQHLSSGGSAAIVRRARAEGHPVTAEASPHHLLLTEEACSGGDPDTKMNPPLRTSDDVDRIKEAIADGTITVLATDHAPHPMATKSVPFAEASFGIVGLECALPLYVRALVDDGVIDWPRLLAMMTVHPARLIAGAERGLGRLAAGGPADVTIIDPAAEWTIRADAFASRGRNCPFDGWPVRSRAIATIVGGEIRRAPTADRIAGLLARSRAGS